MKTWFKFKAKATAPESVEVSIFDEIGMWGVSAKDFISELKNKAAGKKVCLSINSPGGSVFDALAIYNALRASGSEVEVKILGVAASAASLIAMAGDKIIMPENTFMMIHNPWAVAAGNAEELRDFADTLDTIGSSLVKTYVARTGMSEQDVKDLLAAETWLTAQDAVDKGFADEIEPALKVAASYYTGNLPENIKAAIVTVTVEENCTTNADGSESETTTTTVTTESGDAADTEDSGDTGGMDGETEDSAAQASAQRTPSVVAQVAEMVKAAGLEAFSATFVLDSRIQQVSDAEPLIQNALQVQELCALAGKPEMADEMIRAGADLAKARAALCDALALQDASRQTDTTQRAQGSQEPSAATRYANSPWAKIFPTAEQRK